LTANRQSRLAARIIGRAVRIELFLSAAQGNGSLKEIAEEVALTVGATRSRECAKLWCDHAVRANLVWLATGRKPVSTDGMHLPKCH
jgi:hypothetical protein